MTRQIGEQRGREEAKSPVTQRTWTEEHREGKKGKSPRQVVRTHTLHKAQRMGHPQVQSFVPLQGLRRRQSEGLDERAD